MLSDSELLRDYVDRGDQAAFTALVQRHLNVVYRTALRRVGGNAHAADDVTQRVFTALAQKAPKLKSYASLTGWLYTSTRFAAAELVRGEQRRRKHEQEAHTMNELTAGGVSAQQIEPFLDEIMEQLPARDREAVLLHFFERRSFVEIAAMLSSSADATRMRVNRALDKIRGDLAKQGIVSTGAALAVALANQSTLAATTPAAAAIATQALAQAATTMPLAVSIGTRLASALKSSTVIWGTVGTVAIVGVAVSVRLISSRTAEATPSAPTAEIVADSPAYVVPRPSEQNVAPTARPEAAPKNTIVTPPKSAGLAFSSLMPEEQNILAYLWQRFDPKDPTRRLVIRVGGNAPNFPGVAPLIAKQWVRVGSNSPLGSISVMLSNPGIEYCGARAAEIEAYEPKGSFTSSEP